MARCAGFASGTIVPAVVLPPLAQPAIPVAGPPVGGPAAKFVPPVHDSDSNELSQAHECLDDNLVSEDDRADPLLSEKVAPLLHIMARALKIELPPCPIAVD